MVTKHFSPNKVESFARKILFVIRGRGRAGGKTGRAGGEIA